MVGAKVARVGWGAELTNADGAHIRVSPQTYYYNGSLGLLSEYAVSRQNVNRVADGSIFRDTFTNKGWQVSGNYVLTGELASFKGITPRTNFDWEKGTWGALEAVSRYGHLNIDNSIFENGFANPATSVTQADEWGVALNWYPHKNVRVGVDFEHTEFERGAASGGNRPAENIVFTRLQLAY